MGDPVQRRGPLDGYGAVFAGLSAHGLRVDVAPTVAQINLRGTFNQVAAAVSATFDGAGLAQPTNAATHCGSLWTFCLGPDEWLLVATADHADGADKLAAHLAGRHASVVDVSANRVTLDIGGPNAAALFSSLCSLDLADLTSDRCAQTMLAKAQVLVHTVGDGATFRVFVRMSFARYLADAIVDAAAFL
jgi:sarcosine oxidase, subunit gamma